MVQTRKATAVAMTACGLLLAAGCGGGGGGSGGDDSPLPPPASSETTLSVGSRSVSVAADYGDPAPSSAVHLGVTNPPASGLYAGAVLTGDVVAYVDFIARTPTEADLVVNLRSPVDLPVGTSNGTVTVHVCYDDQCAREVRGSPVTIDVSYSVASRSAVALATPSVSVTGNMLEGNLPVKATATVNLTRPPSIGITFRLNDGSSIVQSVANLGEGPATADLQLTFEPAASVGIGTHTENVVVHACYDADCVREIPGSPLVIATSYVVVSGIRPEEGVTPLAYLSRKLLSHDVVDAEYVRARDAIAMVSSAPTSAFYLYDVATGTERQVPLNRAPTAISVAPDGQTVAVGHDALITHIDLAALVAGTASTKLLDVSARVGDLVLDGRGKVHVLPATDQWVDVHSVDVGTNTETRKYGPLYAGSRGRLHPSGDYMYVANNGLTPSDIEKYDLRSGVATRLYDSPYHGDYAMCGNVWLKEDGATIYTRCGNTFRASTLQSQDMVYGGRLQLSASQFYGYQVDSLSQSDASKEIVLLETDVYECAPYRSNDRCYSHLAVFESDFLNRTSLFSLAPIDVAGHTYMQRGLFVFHSRDGLHRYLISRLDPAPNATQSHYLTVVQ